MNDDPKLPSLEELAELAHECKEWRDDISFLDLSSPEDQIKVKLSLYIRNKNTLREFEDWFVPFSWKNETDIGYKVSGIMAESQYYTEDEIKEKLKGLLKELL